jgi:DNA segregation ATPase FtsK/SpoIIIE-like protein
VFEKSSKKRNFNMSQNEISPEQFDAYYQLAVNFIQRKSHYTCSELQRHLRISYSLAQQIIAKLASEAYPIPDQTTSLVEPKITIVFVNNSGVESIQKISIKNIPNLNLVRIDG